MNRLLLFFVISGALLISSCGSQSTQPEQPPAIVALAERVQPGLSRHFIFELTTDTIERFEIESVGKKIAVRGTTLSCISAGLGWYLKYYCNSGTFWTVERNKISLPLPTIEQKIVKQTSMPYRYYMNHCVDRYTYRYWDWQRWEKELDWMALNGANIGMLFLDRMAVMHKLAEDLGVEETYNRYYCDEIMPATQFFYQLHEYERVQLDKRIELQQAIIARMRELGIEPALDGFKAIVPRQLTQTVTDVNFIDGGDWFGYTKEPVIAVNDPYFMEFGRMYYQKQKELYGEQFFIICDPIIEGAGPELDYGELGLKIQNLILEAYPNAMWVLQGWHGNPRDALLTKTNSERTLLLDLFCENDPQWRERDIYNHTPWVWSLINNFGGRTGLYGNLDNIFDQQAEARTMEQGRFMLGVGALMEAIENNPIVYNALFESAWMNTKPDMQQWVRQYIRSRYGTQNEHAEKAWEVLREKVYSATRFQDGATDNIMGARPKLKITGVWSYGIAEPYFSLDDISPAWDYMMLASNELGENDAFQLDLVEITRQILANYAWELYPSVIDAHKEGNSELFESLSAQFLELFDDMEMLLSSRQETMIGHWIDMARSWGETETQKNYMERWAKTMITVYGERPLSETVGLYDYAYREWAGIMTDLYKARFELFFNELKKMNDKNIEPEIDWFDFDYAWTVSLHNYPSTPQFCPIEIIKTIYIKYRNII